MDIDNADLFFFQLRQLLRHITAMTVGGVRLVTKQGETSLAHAFSQEFQFLRAFGQNLFLIIAKHLFPGDQAGFGLLPPLRRGAQPRQMKILNLMGFQTFS